ncbi:hypothetical protein MLD38_016462 [Melastoma candidum]|uniref:Uncharacterized protein n=1 Tax=Melastoma candidum TaxID=119954 RepID=A0ACB9QNP9_9MYRT|nr:hypothetical protein MLD38_016462 [Melastoma candidum]
MRHLSSLLNRFTRSLSVNKGKSLGDPCDGRDAVSEQVKEAKTNGMILCSSGTMNVEGNENFASVFSKRGQKGVNQDCCVVWKEFGCQNDMMLCGVFDGHGPWDHYVAKRLREMLPSVLLHSWQETLAKASVDCNLHLEVLENQQLFNVWKSSYVKACATVDNDLGRHRKIGSFNSGTTALTMVRQGEYIYLANVGDSRAVLATTSDDGRLVPIQLTIDFKPNLSEEAERITLCNGRVFCLHDEPGVHRVWLPHNEFPGLAMSRAFGDFCIKNYGLISIPEVTQRRITDRDEFILLATDGVWDVLTNQEAVEIVSSSTDKARSAKRLVEYAARPWKRKRRGAAADDISAVCLFFHTSQLSYGTNPDYYCHCHHQNIYGKTDQIGNAAGGMRRESVMVLGLCNLQM